MRIDLQGVIAAQTATQAIQPGAAGAAGAGAGAGAASRSAASTPAPAADVTTLSAPGQSVPSLAAQALETAEVRLAKVDALQRAVSSGAYTLDPSLIAEALVNSGL